jgi:hypothetical protein
VVILLPLVVEIALATAQPPRHLVVVLFCFVLVLVFVLFFLLCLKICAIFLGPLQILEVLTGNSALFGDPCARLSRHTRLPSVVLSSKGARLYLDYIFSSSGCQLSRLPASDWAASSVRLISPFYK